jgi:hypothetical protein
MELRAFANKSSRFVNRRLLGRAVTFMDNGLNSTYILYL